MAEQSSAPRLVKEIPPQVVNEGAAYELNLNDFIQSPTPEGGTVHFVGELNDGRSLPAGMICTDNGMLSGIPAKNTMGSYQFVIIAENESGIPLVTEFPFTIKERITLNEEGNVANQLKAKVWEALGKNLPIPDINMADLFDFNRPLTAIEIYYLMERFATLTIWDVYNLDPPGKKQLLTLQDCSKHYNIYDCGSCIIGAPKDLFSHVRTLEDALQTSRAMAREVYNRGWTIEFGGFNKMVRAGWVELQVLADKYGKQLDVLHYTPSNQDVALYQTQAKTLNLITKVME
jgi:hypothetical protein